MCQVAPADLHMTVYKLHAAPYMVNAVKTDGPRDSWSLQENKEITKQQQKKKISKYIRVVLIFHWVKECSEYFSALEST